MNLREAWRTATGGPIQEAWDTHDAEDGVGSQVTTGAATSMTRGATGSPGHAGCNAHSE
jgi:hypothetical protein